MDDKNAFDILNEEFSQHDLEMENARNLERLRRRQESQQAAQQAARREEQVNLFEVDGDDDDEQEDKIGCFGMGFRILIILLLAGALAWMIFMPAGSIGELRELLKDKISEAYSWAEGLLDGESGGADGNQAQKEAEDTGVSSRSSDRTSLNEDQRRTDDSPSENQTEVSTAASQPGDYRITVYRPSQIVIVYDAAGNPAKVFSCSSGKSSTPTRLGDYAIRAKYRWRFMVGNCYTQYASSFSSGYLFHSIPYNKKNAATMSDSSYDKLGNPASSGCIRLCFRDSKWIYDNCSIGTKVSVIDEDAPAGTIPEIIPERIKDKAHSGWDPTDDSPDNPYNS